jgi:hypothetical protein
MKGKFLSDGDYDILVQGDCDAHNLSGDLLFRFRKAALPFEVVKQGYEAFKDSISLTDGRGMASGGSKKRIRNDGSVSNITVGANKVRSGNVGYMDSNAMVPYCRKTAFARDYFEKFKQGIPFIEHVDKLYAELCPAYHKRQMAIARGTNKSYRIGDTSFTTVTVNENFQTAVHKDSGDYPDGFGNLCVYREGSFDGSYFCLPEYRVAIDMQTTDMLFVDVHTWHGNTPFKDMSPDYKRIAFVMYYREYMYQCDSPSKQLAKIKQDKNGFFTL